MWELSEDPRIQDPEDPESSSPGNQLSALHYLIDSTRVPWHIRSSKAAAAAVTAGRGAEGSAVRSEDRR